MEKVIKLKYEKPELVDFEWMEGMGDCSPTATGDVGSKDCSDGAGATNTCYVGEHATNVCGTGNDPHP